LNEQKNISIFTAQINLMIQHTINLAFTEYHSAEELSTDDRQLLEKAWEACKSAYAPYSNFFVGAALKMNNGVIITGNNQENAAYPSGLCAERVAVFSASSQYPGIPIESIAIVAKTEVFDLSHPVTPCGGCRQVLAEYENLSGQPIRTLMQGSSGNVWVVDSISNFLPLTFQGDQLKK
jgi:cytidine deaminase